MTNSDPSSTSQEQPETLLEFSDEEIRHGVHRFPFKKILRGSPINSLLYAVLCAVHEGILTRQELYRHLGCLFSTQLRRSSIVPADVDEAIQHGFNEQLLVQEAGKFKLTEKGKTVLRRSRLQILHSSFWLQRFLTERFVLIISAIILLAMATAKIWVGLSIGSEGMLSEGIENSTDLIKVGIIALSIKYRRDKVGAIIIIGLLLVTGITLALGAIESFLINEAIIVTVQAYFITAISIILNIALIATKVVVGRMSGNLSLLSDAKDNELHTKISIGVLTGLTFAIFHFWFVDSLVALFIAALILMEGLRTMKELIAAGENLTINTIRLSAGARYEDKITDWVLTRLTTSPSTITQLNEEFLEGLTTGVRYFDIHAILGQMSIEDFYNRSEGAKTNILQGIRSGVIAKTGDQLSITNKGLAWYYKFRAHEFHRMAREFGKTGPSWWTYAKIALIIIAIILLIVNAEFINNLLSSI